MDAWTSCHLAISVNVVGNKRVGDFMLDGFGSLFARSSGSECHPIWRAFALGCGRGGLVVCSVQSGLKFWGAGVRYYALC